MPDRTKQTQDELARRAEANGARPAAASGRSANGGPHPASLTARQLREANSGQHSGAQGSEPQCEEDIPDVGSGRIGTISEAAQRLRDAGVIPPEQPISRPGDFERRGPALPSQRRLRPVHKRKSFWATLLAMIVLLGVPFLLWYFSVTTDPVTGVRVIRGSQLPGADILINPQKALINAFDGQTEVHFLLVGLDHVPPTRRDPNPIHRSDSVILVTTNLVNKEVRMLSIPRDGWVMHIGRDGEELGWDKLAHTYANGSDENREDPEGGIRRTKMTVENLMGIPVNYYMIIEIEGFQKIIDELGGITIDVEKRMKYRDRAGGLNIDLQPGVQLLNGEQAMGYARFRHDAVGDIGRMGRQQQVIKAIITELQKPANIPKLPVLGQLLGQALRTNLRMDQMLALTNQSRKFELSRIQSQTLPSYWNREPGHRIDLPGADGGMDAQYINPDEVAQYREFLLNLEPPPPPPVEGEDEEAPDAEDPPGAQFMGGSDLEAAEDVAEDVSNTRNPCAGE